MGVHVVPSVDLWMGTPLPTPTTAVGLAAKQQMRFPAVDDVNPAVQLKEAPVVEE
jgi:hypothetical protein